MPKVIKKVLKAAKKDVVTYLSSKGGWRSGEEIIDGVKKSSSIEPVYHSSYYSMAIHALEDEGKIEHKWHNTKDGGYREYRIKKDENSLD